MYARDGESLRDPRASASLTLSRPCFAGACVFICALLLAGAYLIGINAWLGSAHFRDLINPAGNDVTIAFRAAHSYLPGRVTAEDLVITARHGDGLEWEATFAEATLGMKINNSS